MLDKRFFLYGCTASLLLLLDSVSALAQHNFTDIHPADIQVGRKADEAPAKFSAAPNRDQNREPRGQQATPREFDIDPNSIFNNELRRDALAPQGSDNPRLESSTFQADLHAQPDPPQPTRLTGFQESQANAAVDPMQELNPNRQMPQFGPPSEVNEPLRQTSQPPGLQPQYFDRAEPDDRSTSEPAAAPPEYRATEIPRSFTPDSESIEPTGYQQGFGAPASNANPDAQNVKSLLANYEVSQSSQPLPGIPVSLEDLLRSTPIQSRMSMIQQYWETWFDWATIRNNISYADWLSQLPDPGSGPEQMLLQTARSMAANETLAAEIQLSRSQSKLQQLSRWSGEELLPLPLNQPLVNRYITHYEWYSQRQRLPAKLKGINEMLPRTYELLANRAATIQQAEQTRDQMKQVFAARQLGIGDLLESGRTWRASMDGFVSTVVSYNQAISDYALTITPPQNPVDQIVSMLVARSDSVADVAQRNSILQPTGQPQQFPPSVNRNGLETNQPLNPAQQPEGQNRSVQPSVSQQQQFQPQGSGVQPSHNTPSTTRPPGPQSNESNVFGGGNSVPPAGNQFNSGGGSFGGG